MSTSTHCNLSRRNTAVTFVPPAARPRRQRPSRPYAPVCALEPAPKRAPLRPATILLALASAAILLHSAPTHPATDQRTISGVPRVIDGDSLVISKTRIRLAQLDAPELKQTCRLPSGRVLQCGIEAKVQLQRIIARSSGVVSCDVLNTDRYGRAVAVCYADGVDVGHVMVTDGYALAYRQFGSRYVAAEKQARANHCGVWATSFTEPWEWRKQMRDAKR